MKALALLGLGLAACTASPDARGHDDVAYATHADTLRGTVQVVGSEPGTAAVLEVPGLRTVALNGELATLRQLGGIEVMVQGSAREAGSFDVASVTVRAVSGIPAIDGITHRDGDAWFIITADGTRHPAPQLPPSLRSQTGLRVWLAGPLSRSPDAWGVIR